MYINLTSVIYFRSMCELLLSICKHLISTRRVNENLAESESKYGDDKIDLVFYVGTIVK